MNKKIIYADDLLLAIRDDDMIDGKNFSIIRDHIKNAKAVDTVKVVHGRWIEDYVYAADPHDRLRYKCSICGRPEEGKEPYCNCGAKMDGGKE